ncbi:MAG TPA: carboxypeptidase regulatory-like domain-containing protein, partial [Blastocatellia bacterium]
MNSSQAYKKQKRLVWRTLVVFAMTLALAAQSALVALAQTETGQITVKITDPQGAAVSGASVNVRSVEKGTALPAITTGDEGTATITNLQSGLYEVTVTSQGFANFTQRAQVTVGSKLAIEVHLTVAGSGEVVNVIAGEGGVEVNTQTQELSTVVSTAQVRELPTITRNPYDLVTLSGNVSDGDQVNLTNLRGTGFNINGQRSSSTSILLDGGENVNSFDTLVGQSVPLDAVQEFRIITSNFSAEYGRAAGGIVNVTTKAGTNDFHGTIFEFNRVSALASNSFDNNARGLDKDVFTRNQFGYSVGGRVIKDKLFFFNSTEWIRVRSGATQTIFVPTPELIGAANARTQAVFSTFPLRPDLSFGRTVTVGEAINDLNIGAGA